MITLSKQISKKNFGNDFHDIIVLISLHFCFIEEKSNLEAKVISCSVLII